MVDSSCTTAVRRSTWVAPTVVSISASRTDVTATTLRTLVSSLLALLLFGGCDLDEDGFTVVTDCDDSDPLINPDAVERCDGVDEDCDGFVDDGLVFTSFRPDADGDAFGDIDSPEVRACSAPPGHVGDASDCDDRDPSAHPGASEVCDGTDNDCDFDVDEDLRVLEYRRDDDEDGWGNQSGEVLASCQPVPGLVVRGGDCNDDDDTVHPEAEEVCNDVDDNCNGGIDDGLHFERWWPDVDGDGFGDETAIPFLACDTPEDAALDDGTDCDDNNANVYPDQADPCLDCDLSNDAGCRR
jgi:hypothetical protein